MQRDDMLIHTSLSHATADQNLLEIAKLESLGKAVCFGQHAIDQEICFAAIGAGAKKIFIYIGDKSLDLPDYYHAISPSEVLDFYSRCSACFVAMQPGEYSGKSLKIKFLG
jgi:hypothetical protein